MRVADYITDQIYKAGGEDVFLITGGMIMHLMDALLLHPHQRYVCCHHEQAAAMAAEAYGRYTGRLGAAYVTAGPGALNTLTGVVGAYLDGAPCIIVAGQSKISQAKVVGPRQFAHQGFHTLPIFQQVTKYAVMLDDITRVRYEVEKAIYMATSHRVGPVWLEVPIDIQGAPFEPSQYEGYTPEPSEQALFKPDSADVARVAEALRNSRRPSIIAGAGVRASGAVEALQRFIEKRNIPMMTSRLGMDLISVDHPLYVGRPGTYGDRPANFTVQNSDLLIVLGCRLAIGLVGYDYQGFAPNATKIMVDVDVKELEKPSVVPDIPVLADVDLFLRALEEALGDFRFDNQPWVEQTQHWKHTYPTALPEYAEETEGVNSYHFTDVFSRKLPEDAVFSCDTGSCFHVHAQAFRVKYGQRHIITGGLSTMGYFPGSVGVAVARKDRDVYCITGDGSFQMNLQELQTIAHHHLPVKIVMYHNSGYLLIRLTQVNFQESRFMGIDTPTGMSTPDMEKIADAYGIHFIRIASRDELDAKLDELIAYKGPVICEVRMPSDQLLGPRVASRKLDDGSMVSCPYDDMFPFLPRDEYEQNNVCGRIV